MDRTTLARTAIAGTVAALGLAVGGVALASADSNEAPDIAVGAHPLHVAGDAAEVIAEELGLDEDVVEDALRAVHDELRPDRPDLSDGFRPELPSEEDLAERRAAFAAALAEELGVSEARVEAALEKLHEEAEEKADELRADLRERLVKRLDEAVEDGTLTEADKASVLKAYDAEVIGGGAFMGGMFIGRHFGGFAFGGPHGHDL